MRNALDQVPQGGRVVIVRLRSLGDCVLTTPAIGLLKQARPDLKIGVVVENRFADVFSGNPDVHAILSPSLTRLRSFKPNLCINMHGGTRSTRLTAFSGAELRAGFADFHYPPLYHVRIPRAQSVLEVERQVHTAEHLASAMFYLGVPRQEIPQARVYARCGAAARRGLRDYAIIHPSASRADKQWPAAFFTSTAQFISRSLGLEPVFIGGPGEDLSAFQIWSTITSAPVDEIKSLISEATVFLGNDSGPAHIAAACSVPSVVLFGPSDPGIWGPWRAPAEVLRADAVMQDISEDQVFQALGRLRAIAA